MERGLFYLPCGNRQDDMHHHSKDGMTLNIDGMGGVNHASTRKYGMRYVLTIPTQIQMIRSI